MKDEEKNLIHKILQLAGVSTKDFNTAQFANAEEAKSIQQENLALPDFLIYPETQPITFGSNI